MTSTERLTEIEDFCDWMDQVYTFAKTSAPNAKVICFGFSQGAATIMRWLQARRKEYHRIVLWSGTPPEDIDYPAGEFPTSKLISYWGKNDELVAWEKAAQRFEQVSLEFQQRFFDGGHRIEAESLVLLADELLAELSESDRL